MTYFDFPFCLDTLSPRFRFADLHQQFKKKYYCVHMNRTRKDTSSFVLLVIFYSSDINRQPFNNHYKEHTAATYHAQLPSPRLRVRHCISRNSIYIERARYDLCRQVVCVSQPSLTGKLPVHQTIALQSHSTLLLKKYKIDLILIQASAS